MDDIPHLPSAGDVHRRSQLARTLPPRAEPCDPRQTPQPPRPKVRPRNLPAPSKVQSIQEKKTKTRLTISKPSAIGRAHCRSRHATFQQEWWRPQVAKDKETNFRRSQVVDFNASQRGLFQSVNGVLHDSGSQISASPMTSADSHVFLLEMLARLCPRLTNTGRRSVPV